MRPERKALPDKELYQPQFSPWLAETGEFRQLISKAKPFSLVSEDRLWILYSLAQQARHLTGEFWECGVYKGGTAIILADILRAAPDKTLRLFDTFSGMPETDPDKDYHRKGDFADTSLASVKQRLDDKDNIEFHQGFIPDTFQGLEHEKLAFAHIDVDIYQSVLDCCEFIYPRLVSGGFMLFDDYGFPSCPGARAAVDSFFADKIEVPLVLSTGQAFVIKSPGKHL